MQNITIESSTGAAKEPTLRDHYDRMGPRNGIAGRVVAQLAAQGVKVAISTVFNVIYGRSGHPAVTDAF